MILRLNISFWFSTGLAFVSFVWHSFRSVLDFLQFFSLFQTNETNEKNSFRFVRLLKLMAANDVSFKAALENGDGTITMRPSKRKNGCELWKEDFGFPKVNGVEVILMILIKQL